jgi:hypothetical protein
MQFEQMLHDSFIAQKVKDSEIYAQNLYAALCNMQWRDPNNISTGLFSVTWRTAGGIVAGLRDTGGDYLDWYCSGMGEKMPGEVSEGTVTAEIAHDLAQLGWCPEPYNDNMFI